MPTIDERVARAQRQRKEEQVTAAILHMVSPLGILALIPSGVVWAVSRSRSRFLCLQALQALLFQAVALALAVGTFLLFMAGFYFAMFSGMVARTGVTDPELTTNLTVAMVAGFAIVFFFQFAFPCWGVWAGLQILRGRAYRYPLIGKLAMRWTSRQPFVVEPTDRPRPRLAPDDNGQNILGVLAHLSVLAGMSVILSPVLWATTRSRTRYLTHHLLQAPLFQIGTTTLMWFFFFVVWGGGVLGSLAYPLAGYLPQPVVVVINIIAVVTLYPVGWMVLLGLIWIITVVLAIVAGIQTARGRDFNYPIVGKWLARYTQ